MNRVNRQIRFRLFYFGLAICLVASGQPSVAANKAKIQEAIIKAQRFLVQQKLSGAQGELAALAYIKSGGDKKTDNIQQAVADVLRKFESARFHPTNHFVYEAGVDLMLLEAMDPEAYRTEMQMIVDFIVVNQQSNGSWYYNHDLEPDCGDTSISQYALLGLWAASRAGIEFPVEVWDKAAQWHITKQLDEGAFAYHPFDKKVKPEIDDRRPRATMTAAGSSNLLIIRRVLFGDAEMDTELRPAEIKRRFGVLERFVDEKSAQKTGIGATTVRPAALDKALKSSYRWTTSHFPDRSANTERWYTYYLYCVERVAALMDVESMGSHDWYDEGADELLKRQLPDGSWTDANGILPATGFGLMFLSKATTTIVTPKKRIATVGGGLQAGGRGLPDNLGAVAVKDGNVSSRKIVGSVDNLLIELERSSDAKVEDVQAAVVEAVQVDRPDELIGQVQRLRKLATDARVEVRRTAFWALGRSGDVAAGFVLVQGLGDSDISVVREASLGLCILSRRPEGCGTPIDPTDDSEMELNEDSSDDDRKAKLEAWKTKSKKLWYDWYQKNRPYDERDDRTAIKQKKK